MIFEKDCVETEFLCLSGSGLCSLKKTEYLMLRRSRYFVPKVELSFVVKVAK